MKVVSPSCGVGKEKSESFAVQAKTVGKTDKNTLDTAPVHYRRIRKTTLPSVAAGLFYMIKNDAAAVTLRKTRFPNDLFSRVELATRYRATFWLSGIGAREKPPTRDRQGWRVSAGSDIRPVQWGVKMMRMKQVPPHRPNVSSLPQTAAASTPRQSLFHGQSPCWLLEVGVRFADFKPVPLLLVAGWGKFRGVQDGEGEGAGLVSSRE